MKYFKRKRILWPNKNIKIIFAPCWVQKKKQLNTENVIYGHVFQTITYCACYWTKYWVFSMHTPLSNETCNPHCLNHLVAKRRNQVKFPKIWHSPTLNDCYIHSCDWMEKLILLMISHDLHKHRLTLHYRTTSIYLPTSNHFHRGSTAISWKWHLNKRTEDLWWIFLECICFSITIYKFSLVTSFFQVKGGHDPALPSNILRRTLVR